MPKKFDVYFAIGFPFRVLQGVSQSDLDAFCENRGYKVVRVEQIGAFYHDAFIK
ncbi:hypothetical protein [Paraburkholderia sp. GAS32]|uniref:hypothetical protein n=1 Tax=Paraburkholderia sp. GAS32 TaxID=3035129 RepID=UPI003D2490AE